MQFEETDQRRTNIRIILPIDHLRFGRNRDGVGQPSVEQFGVPDFAFQCFFNAFRIGKPRYSCGFTARGKPGPAAPGGARHGLNDYTGWFAGNPEMAGPYFGYDGPFPPFNDSLVHHYVFTLYAVSVARLPLTGAFTGAQVREQLAGRALGEATFSGTYTLNQRLLDSGI